MNKFNQSYSATFYNTVIEKDNLINSFFLVSFSLFIFFFFCIFPSTQPQYSQMTVGLLMKQDELRQTYWSNIISTTFSFLFEILKFVFTEYFFLYFWGKKPQLLQPMVSIIYGFPSFTILLPQPYFELLIKNEIDLSHRLHSKAFNFS